MTGRKKNEKSVDQKSAALYYRPVNVRQKSRSMPPIDPAKGNPAFFGICPFFGVVMNEKILKNKEFKLFYEISTIVSSSMDLSNILSKVLDILAENAGVERSTITILNDKKDALYIIAAHNLSSEEQKKGFYQLGEGITGKVAKSGKAMIIPKINEEPLFLNKTKTRNNKADISFICVPITIANKVIINSPKNLFILNSPLFLFCLFSSFTPPIP